MAASERRQLARAVKAHERAGRRVDQILEDFAAQAVRYSDLGAVLGGIGRAGVSERLRTIRARARTVGALEHADEGSLSGEASVSRGPTSGPVPSGERGSG